MMAVCYYDAEDCFKHFWRCSLNKNMNSFDFDKAFEFVLSEIKRKLAEHGLLSFEEFQENEEEIGYANADALETFEQCTTYIHIGREELLEAIQRHKYKRNRETFETFGSFQILKGLYDQLQNFYSLEQKEQVLLFDKCIHAEHETGMIFDVDVEELRQEIEEEFKENN
jgi:SAM-dependent methyltransferase